MKTIDDVLERLDGESTAMVVQLSAKECAEMARIVRESNPAIDLTELVAAAVGSFARDLGLGMAGHLHPKHLEKLAVLPEPSSNGGR